MESNAIKHAFLSREFYQGHWVRSRIASASQTHFPDCSQGKFMNMVRSAFPLIFLGENLEVVKRAIAWQLI
ncbi:hypothetical protein [Cylindrospermopsis raciborskii]|uniref:hypothetical protein n=1 Tax=Cylindrospermopsis raciborskii TaxID=77022 RepID=UPI0008DC8E54|nr:hypothetical protein [Cylindrospermopsis raciborskii]OHY35923.1 hypothetical protein BCV64_02775 [Cylindrospermopsis raciborskii MVCC14]